MTKKLLRFKLSEATVKTLAETSKRTHISKSELIRLAIKYSLPHASELDLGSKKAIGATEYCNIYADNETHELILALVATDRTAKIASVTRALIEYAVEKNAYLPQYN